MIKFLESLFNKNPPSRLENFVNNLVKSLATRKPKLSNFRYPLDKISYLIELQIFMFSKPLIDNLAQSKRQIKNFLPDKNEANILYKHFPYDPLFIEVLALFSTAVSVSDGFVYEQINPHDFSKEEVFFLSSNNVREYLAVLCGEDTAISYSQKRRSYLDAIKRKKDLFNLFFNNIYVTWTKHVGLPDRRNNLAINSLFNILPLIAGPFPDNLMLPLQSACNDIYKNRDAILEEINDKT